MTQTTTTIQGDPFCRCGRNLHGLTVIRDARTNLPLAECPACGAFHAAGAADTAVTQWAARFYAALVLAWAATLLAVAVAAAALQTFCNGVAAEQVFFTGPGDAGNGSFQEIGTQSRLFWQLAFLLLPLGLGAFLGTLQAVAMWHVRGPTKLLPIAAVLAVAGLFTFLGLYDTPTASPATTPPLG